MKPPIYSPYRPRKFRSQAFRPSTPTDTMVGVLGGLLAGAVFWVVVLV